MAGLISKYVSPVTIFVGLKGVMIGGRVGCALIILHGCGKRGAQEDAERIQPHGRRCYPQCNTMCVLIALA